MPTKFEKKLAALEDLPRVIGTVVEENEDLLILKAGPRLLEIPKASVKEVKKGTGGREGTVEVTLLKDAQIIQSVAVSPGEKVILSAELLGALRIDQVASNCNCNCNCDTASNCNCNCNCDCSDCSDCSGSLEGRPAFGGRPINPALLINVRQFQRAVTRTT